MIKNLIFLAFMLNSLNAIALTDLKDISIVKNSDCAEECLQLKQFNSGEAFYIWTTGSVKIA